MRSLEMLGYIAQSRVTMHKQEVDILHEALPVQWIHILHTMCHLFLCTHLNQKNR